jgi:PhnB protein
MPKNPRTPPATQSSTPSTTWIEAALAGCPLQTFQERLRQDLQRRTLMLTTIARREGFTTVTPYLTVADVERLVSFAKEVFGAVETERTTGSAGGTHYELRIGDSMLMCGGGAPARGKEKRAALHIQVPDVDAVYAQALKAGAKSVSAPQNKPYGERLAEVTDPVGNTWYIATHDGPLEAGIRTVTPYLLRPNALELVEFLKTAFSAREAGIYKSPEGKLMHGAMWIGDALVELGEFQGEPSAFYLYVPDADALYQQALEAGAKSLYPPADQPYGDRMGGVEDAWGNTWYIARPA